MKIGHIVYRHLNTPEADYVRDSLLKYHLFPSVKDLNDEVPPVFTSQGLSPEIADELFALLPDKKKKTPLEHRRQSFSPMRYTALKFNGSIRAMQVPHPVPYARLVRHLHSHWNDLDGKLSSGNSRVKPEKIGDGRLFSMNYGAQEIKVTEEAKSLTGCTHVAMADIANFFPSVYTHAIDWAIRGKAECKKNRDVGEWSFQLDTRVRDLQDQESIGVAIGPGTSNVVTEIILQKVDTLLCEQGFDFVRFIDDYKCYATSKEDAERFLTQLNQLLYEYRLGLNHRKSRIVEVSDYELDGWIEEVRGLAPLPDDTTVVLVRKIRALEKLSTEYKDHSVLNYGLGSFLRSAPDFPDEKIIALSYELGRIVWLAPATISRIVRLVAPRLTGNPVAREHFAGALTKVIEQADLRREADTVLWGLYGIFLMNYTFKEAYLEKATAWCPLIGAATLGMFPKQSRGLLTAQVQTLDKESNSTLDEFWLPRYELWKLGDLSDADLSQDRELEYFRVLKGAAVSFLGSPTAEDCGSHQ